MARRCIFGCERAGSGEHVFPATLGGRRVNKGILCDKHNGALSPLAGVLSEQLRLLNAQIGVRPDHNKSKPHASVLMDAEEREYVASVDGIRVKGGRILLDHPTENGGRAVEMEFGSQAELDSWVEAQRAAGYDFEQMSQSKGTRVTHGHLKGTIKLGGIEGLRAVGYVALTFLAHRFPDLAGSEALEPFRRFVLEDGHPNDFVWWLDPPAASSQSPHPFGHKIEISVPKLGNAQARVTFFSTIAFGVYFGPSNAANSETVTTWIDPLALNPPNDVLEDRCEGADIDLVRPVSHTETLRRATTTGTAERAFSAFMRKVTDYRLLEDMRPVHDLLLTAAVLDDSKRRAAVDKVVEGNAQQVLNLIRYVADDIRTKCDLTNEAGRIIVEYLDDMFPKGREPSPEFFQASDELQSSARRAIAETIDNELVNGSLDLDRLSMLLGGRPGAAIAGEAVMQSLYERLP